MRISKTWIQLFQTRGKTKKLETSDSALRNASRKKGMLVVFNTKEIGDIETEATSARVQGQSGIGSAERR